MFPSHIFPTSALNMSRLSCSTITHPGRSPFFYGLKAIKASYEGWMRSLNSGIFFWRPLDVSMDLVLLDFVGVCRGIAPESPIDSSEFKPPVQGLEHGSYITSGT